MENITNSAQPIISFDSPTHGEGRTKMHKGRVESDRHNGSKMHTRCNENVMKREAS